MEIRNAASPQDAKFYTTKRLREEFLIPQIFIPGELKLVYSHIDRMITGGAMPLKNAVRLEVKAELRADFFLQRREMGVINIGGKGKITVDGKVYPLDTKQGMYIGRGSKDIVFESENEQEPAKFYINSAPAHRACKTVLIVPTKEEIPLDVPKDEVIVILDQNKVELGTIEESNHRTICKYILPGQVESCQLEMGMTSLMPGSVWNTMPAHTHERRMEVYLYFKLPPDAFVMHYMGEPTETRHLVVRNEQAVISPSWSIHAGSGSRAYTFIWGMVGENQDFDDMDHLGNEELM